jgi:processive 1,2-diacylglycerol beta-glucosyltransferase
MRPKVLVVHASLGSGHRRAAQALHEVLLERNIPAEMQDLLSFLPRRLASFYPGCYDFMVNDCRWLWKFLYKALDKPVRPYAPGKSLLQKWQFRKFLRYLQEEQFTHILSTYFASSALLTDWRKEGILRDVKIYSIITDHVAHRCWRRTGLDHYFVASEAVRQQMKSAGVLEESITVSGIPISKTFRDHPAREKARKHWGCSNEDNLILVLCSGWSYKKTAGVLRELGSLNEELHFLVSTGPDPVKEEKIKKRFAGRSNFRIFGFSPQIAEMMTAADLMISKPGGLIVSEALAIGLPQILLSPIPGQEEANARYAESNGAAVLLSGKKGELANIAGQLLGDAKRLCSMRSAAALAGQPLAAIKIIEEVAPAVPA